MLTIAFIGDVYGSPGRMVVQQQLPHLRDEHRPDVIIANAENARSGSGLSPTIYAKLRAMGIDAITLGDHVFRDQRITSILEKTGEPIARPANLQSKALGRRFIRIDLSQPRTSEPGSSPPRAINADLYIITVLGRIFFNMPADDPFATVDRFLDELPLQSARPRIVIVEAHMEATSEKAALARYLDGRVAAVIGTHTHVPTADARILPGGTAFISDVGMSGPYNSVIGANIEAVVKHMTTGMHVPFGVGSGGEAMCGATVVVDEATGRSRSITRFEYRAEPDQPPFSSP